MMAPRLCVCVFRPDFFPNLSTRERNIDTSAINIHWSSNHRCCRCCGCCGQKEILTETSTAGNYRASQQGPDFHKDLSKMQWKYNENTNTSKNTNTNIASRTKVSTQTYQEYNENAKDGMNATNFENITQISPNILFYHSNQQGKIIKLVLGIIYLIIL